MKFVLYVVFCLFSFAQAEAASDFLAQRSVQIQSSNSSEVLSRTVADPKAVFDHFQMKLDSTTKIVRPLRISGPSDHPIMQVSVEKCMGFICQTVDLDADITVHEARTDCDRNFVLVADLKRSSQEVRDIYDRLDVKICYKAQPDGRGSLVLAASVNQGRNYSTGFVQNEMFKLLQLQVDPIVKAVQETLKSKE